MNLNGIAQACLERNHCRFFFLPFLSTSSLVTGVENGKWEIPKDEETYMSCCSTTVLQHYWIML